MSRATVQPGPSELTPELAAKIRDVELEFARIQQTAKLRYRWFLLGLIPRLMQVMSILGMCWTFVAAALYVYDRSISNSPTSRPDPWAFAGQFIANVVGAFLAILIATWAMRYCQARADGKL